MEIKEIILKSKYVRLLFIGVIIAAAAFWFVEKNSVDMAASSREKQLARFQEMAGSNAEVVIAPGQYDEDIRILDGERGLFLAKCSLLQMEAKEEDTYHIIDAEGRVLADTGCVAIEEKLSRRYWIMAKELGTAYYLVDMEEVLTKGIFTTPQLPEGIDYTNVHQSGEYYMVSWGNYDEVYGLPGNELIYSASEEVVTSEYGLRFTERKGYATYVDNSGRDCLLNLYTGETEYVCGENESIYMDGDFGNMTAIMKPFFAKDKPGGKNQNFVYFLDENYEVALGGTLFSSFGHIDSAEYRVAYMAQAADYYNVETALRDDGFTADSATVVLNKKGDVVYKASPEHGRIIRAIIGDILVVSGDYEHHMDYINLLTGEVIYEDRELLSLLDFEDGIAAAEALPKGYQDGDYDDREIQLPALERLYSDGRCGFIDEDMNPLTELVFDAVTITENGYAVVTFNDDFAVIKFKGAI